MRVPSGVVDREDWGDAPGDVFVISRVRGWRPVVLVLPKTSTLNS